jgi:hypothetical protein
MLPLTKNRQTDEVPRSEHYSFKNIWSFLLRFLMELETLFE